VQYLSFATNAWLEGLNIKVFIFDNFRFFKNTQGGDFKAVIAAALFVFSDTCLAYK